MSSRITALALTLLLAVAWQLPGSPARADATGPIRGPGVTGKCIDVAGDDVGPNGASVQIWDCLGVRDQSWTVVADGTGRHGDTPWRKCQAGRGGG